MKPIHYRVGMEIGMIVGIGTEIVEVSRVVEASEKNRFIEITVDGIISADELNDFKRINEHLSQISTTVSSLQLWIQQAMLENKIATSEEIK